MMNSFTYRLFLVTLLPVVAIALLFSAGCSEGSANEQESSADKILIFTKTDGFRHESIPVGVEAMEELAADNGWETYHTEDASVFNGDSLKEYSAVMFLSTTEDILNGEQEEAFKGFIQNGGGFIGIHAAADTEYDWPWYGELVGAYFASHPQIQEAKMTVLDKDHPSTSHLPDEWVRTDEWYNYKDINTDINVLINLEESSYEGGENGDDHPIAWYHEYDGGRVFYTGGGHTDESYSEPLFLEHIRGGIEYVLDRN